MKEEVLTIINEIIKLSLPDVAVRAALKYFNPPKGKTVIIAIGKAAWKMAKTATECLEGKYDQGFVITKYHHSEGAIPKFSIMEAGHPILDENTVKATEYVLEAVQGLTEDDCVLFLISGGGSALFEKPAISLEEMKKVNMELLACGADIIEMNTIRKRLSSVKGGKFAAMCEPAKVYSILLSDVVGDYPEMIASGPAYPDKSSVEDVEKIILKYNLRYSDKIMNLLLSEPVTKLSNVTTFVGGGVSVLCKSAKKVCEKYGYETEILTDSLNCQAKEAGYFIGSIASYAAKESKKRAFLIGGETVVCLKGDGLGGRNQEIALAAAEKIAGIDNVIIAAFGTDGTDGPTDAAGGIVDGETKEKLEQQGVNIFDVLEKNDSYHALQKTDCLIMTGPTGTNVNDLVIVLIGR